MTGYLYILKHGVGPGALPRGVQILKWKDLPHYYTAVWLSRFLSASEMDDYDIPHETDINYYLDRIGYCQTDDGDDVVPCEDIVATTKIDASVSSKDLKSLAKRVLDCTSFEELSRAIGSLLSIDKDIYCHYMEMLRDESLSLDYIISDLSDTLYNLAAFDTYTRNYNAIHASSDLEDEDFTFEYEVSQVENELEITCRDDGRWIYIFSDEDGRYSPNSYTQLNSYYNKLIKNGEYRRFKPVKKSFQYFEDIITELANTSNSSEEFKDNYREFLINLLGLQDVEACDKVMASMNSDDLEDDGHNYLVRGYYDYIKRGLAEDEWADTLTEVNDIVNNYANKGYYIEVHNLATGTVREFDADDWFDNIFPDGIGGF